MQTLDKKTEKQCPPSDKRINLATFIGSLFAIGILSAYFIISGVTVVMNDKLPLFLFAYIVFPLEVIILAVGLFGCVSQLIRNKYQRIVISLILYLVTLGVGILYMIAVAVRTGSILIPFLF